MDRFIEESESALSSRSTSPYSNNPNTLDPSNSMNVVEEKANELKLPLERDDKMNSDSHYYIESHRSHGNDQPNHHSPRGHSYNEYIFSRDGPVSHHELSRHNYHPEDIRTQSHVKADSRHDLHVRNDSRNGDHYHVRDRDKILHNGGHMGSGGHIGISSPSNQEVWRKSPQAV